MIVDPDTEFSTTVARFARNEGGRTQIASNVNGLAGTGTTADVILVDICPNGVPNLDLVADLRARNRRARIVVVTAYPSVKLAVAALQRGAADFLAKPVEPADLWRKVAPKRSSGADFESTVPLPTLDRVVHEYTTHVLVRLKGNVSAAARVLGIRRSTLQRRLRKYPLAP